MQLAILEDFCGKNLTVTISSSPYVIGRCKSADFIIAHVNISRSHCEIIKGNASWKLNDCSSSGTYVNGALVGKGNFSALNDGDLIRFGPPESNLCYIFYSLDSFGELSCSIKLKSKTLTELDLNSEHQVCSKEKIFTGKAIRDNKCKDKNKLQEKNIHRKFKKQTNIIEQLGANQRDISKVANTSEDIKNTIVFTEGILSIENKIKKIEQELTQNLQPIQGDSEVVKATDFKFEGKFRAKANSYLLENLAELMEAEFQCAICSELFVTAITLSCFHTFCKYCINLWKKKQDFCPICRKKIVNETRSLVVDNYIEKMIENFSLNLKERREAVIKERCRTES